MGLIAGEVYGECGESDGKTFPKNKIKTSVRATKY